MPVGQADAAIALGCRHSPGSCSRWGGPGAEPKASGSAYCPVANSSAGRGHLPAGRMPLDNAGERGLSRSRARSRSGFGAEGLFPSRLGSPPLSVSQSTASPGACGRAEPPPGRGSQSPALPLGQVFGRWARENSRSCLWARFCKTSLVLVSLGLGWAGSLQKHLALR